VEHRETLPPGESRLKEEDIDEDYSAKANKLPQQRKRKRDNNNIPIPAPVDPVPVQMPNPPEPEEILVQPVPLPVQPAGVLEEEVPGLGPPGGVGPKSERAYIKWSSIEDGQLRKAVAELGTKNWKRISQEFFQGERSHIQCLNRWEKGLKPGIRKGFWTEEEDAMVRCVLHQCVLHQCVAMICDQN
jgi:hypothetical protein